MGDQNIFQSGNLTIENPQSKEEDEELEEQRRRQEELEDLLTDGIHAFKYDESTINSSTSTSIDGSEANNVLPKSNPLKFTYEDETTKNSITNRSHDILDNLEENYKDADASEQLKILYEVRMREIKALREEFKNYQQEKMQEITLFKNRITLSEAEIRHFQLSTSNLESLLVEKTEIINSLKRTVNDKDEEILELKSQVEDMKIEICSYASSINELQMKLANDHPFSASARNLNSEQVQQTHHDQVTKLEARLDEETKKREIFERERNNLQEDLRKVLKARIEAEEETDLMIVELSKKLKTSQQQCKDLFNLGEAIKKESDHFKERLKQLQGQENELGLSISKSNGSLDQETLVLHLEKLKRMLLDKNIEMNTLQMKLKLYESDSEELFRYRKILNDLTNSNVIQSCNVDDHKEQLVLLKQQLERSREMVEERNKEIANLHSINKESREKIEEMLTQTRNDIQNLSNRYSLPQLEQMSEDLRNAEQTIQQLRAQLDNNNDDRSDRELVVELEKAHQQIHNLQQKSYDDKINFEEMLEMFKSDLKRSEDEIERLKSSLEELRQSESALKEENRRIKDSEGDYESQSVKSEYEKVKKQLRQVMSKLESAKDFQESDFREKLQELTNTKIIMEGEKLSLEDKIKELENELEDVPNLKKSLMICEENVRKLDSDKADLIKKLKDLEEEKFTKDEAELLTTELNLRETLQEENAKKLTDIEERYKKVLNDKVATYQKEIEILKNQETIYRQQLSVVLAECSQKMILLEESNLKLGQQLRDLGQEYVDHKAKSMRQFKKFEDIIIQNKREFEVMKTNWERMMEERLAGYVGVERQCHKILKGISAKRKHNQAQMEKVDQAYNDKINKFKLKHGL